MCCKLSCLPYVSCEVWFAWFMWYMWFGVYWLLMIWHLEKLWFLAFKRVLWWLLEVFYGFAIERLSWFSTSFMILLFEGYSWFWGWIYKFGSFINWFNFRRKKFYDLVIYLWVGRFYDFVVDFGYWEVLWFRYWFVNLRISEICGWFILRYVYDLF